MTLKGTLSRHDMGAGGWILETDSGEKVALYGDIDGKLSGQKVVVDGDKVDAMGFGMVGSSSVQVRKVSAASSE